MAKKHIIITKLFNSGGSNSHFKTLLKYFGEKNVIVILENKIELTYLKQLTNDDLNVFVIANLQPYAILKYRFTTNLKELFLVVKSIIRILAISIKNGFADITISSVEPERHIYLLAVPFIKIYYILHTLPLTRHTLMTTRICNLFLGPKKKIIAVSNNMSVLMINNWAVKNTKKKHVLTIHNCVHTPIARHERKDQAEKSPLIVTLGHLVKYKNPFLWINVAKTVIATHENIQFLWLGEGPYLNELREQAKDIPNITFLGLVKNPQPYLQQAAIYFHPSLEDSHPIAVIEAMANALPCVASNVGGIPESVIDNFNGIIVDPRDEAKNASALISLVKNNTLRQSFGNNSYLRYQTLFTYEVFKKNMDEVYQTE